ncbi:hypothetical protein J2T60_000395 [Natronospira proteinivora]|uniref:Cyclic di-GMP receptor atypical PilZ domain-containing protein n=1 Tax=Natronospira proteinivora TaxID=1807133 RepID=A0ABT1G666_9GAMM|nr:PilZ domain-containing protein [Natronospira proteinivora]MCP1726430.1 hypothetical protein [Natronospira proteinivora]
MNIATFFSDRVNFRTELPLQWRPSQAPLDEGQLASLNEQNLALLRAVSALEERHSDSPESHQLPLPEVQRLEAKLDLILTLVGQIRAASDIIPPSVTAELSAAGLAWWPREDKTPAVNETGVVEVSLATYAAQPLVLPGKVSAHADWDGGPAVLVIFEGINEVVADALEKFVFRHHRRAIAGSRGQTG